MVNPGGAVVGPVGPAGKEVDGAIPGGVGLAVGEDVGRVGLVGVVAAGAPGAG